MNFTQLSVLLILVVITLCAVLLARVLDLIELRYPDKEYGNGIGEYDDGNGVPLSRMLRRDTAAQAKNSAVLGDNADHLLWFVQISDIHISMFHDPDRINDLKEFCHVTLDAIQPDVVLASGDLSDGKAADHMGSNQYIQEWETYQRVLMETKAPQKTVWLDIRGNHDNFNVPGVNSKRSYFHKYSVQGQNHSRSYVHTIEKESHVYTFIAVDACLEPGPRRPFNFIGNLDKEQFNLLESFEKESHKSSATIWFGHYPTSCIISPKPGIRQLMRNSTAYLCGHLHTLGGMVTNMYTVQHSGLLELELGDWKDNRIYRVAAFDHGLFSFIDVKHEQWPVILVTNPKHALFTFPSNKEPLELIQQSSHIRILVFSPYPIVNIRIKVDDEIWREAKHVKGPVYVAEWNPLEYTSGIHNLHVYAEDEFHNLQEIHHPFSLDGTKLSFQLLPRVVLMTHAQHVFHGFFTTFVILSVLPFILVRYLHYLVKVNKLKKPEFSNSFCGNLFRRFWILVTINRLSIPLSLYPVYLTFGPWFVGEVIEGYIGAAFAWGTLVNWTVLPTSFTYFYGTLQLFWFHIPFVLIMSYCTDMRFKAISLRRTPTKKSSFPIYQAICGLHILTQAIFAYYFWLAYGSLAFILGFMRTWSVFLATYLWYVSSTLSTSEFSEARLICGKYEFVRENGDTFHAM